MEITPGKKMDGSGRDNLDVVAWLKSHKKALNPRPGFIAASLRRLMARIRRELRARARTKSE